MTRYKIEDEIPAETGNYSIRARCPFCKDNRLLERKEVGITEVWKCSKCGYWAYYRDDTTGRWLPNIIE